MPTADEPTIVRPTSTILYIVDAVNLGETRAAEDQDGVPVSADDEAADPHRRTCQKILDTFGKLTNFEIKNVIHPPGTQKKDIIRFWSDELKDKTPEDLIIFWYQGKARGGGTEYFWRFTGYPKKEINAFDIIEAVNKSRASCLMILDCDIPSRAHGRWPHGEGVLEIITSGASLNHGDAKENAHRAGVFSRATCDDVKALVEGINGKFSRSKAPKSLPQMLRTNRALASNPIRINSNKTKGGSREIVERIKLHPEAIRETGGLELFIHTIQGPGEEPARKSEIAIIPGRYLLQDGRYLLQDRIPSAEDKQPVEEDEDEDEDEAIDVNGPADSNDGEGSGEGISNDGPLFVTD